MFSVLLAASLLGQVKGPDRVEVGQIVKLESPGDSGAGWFVQEPIDLKYEEFEQGKYCVFASGCRPGRIIVVAVDWDGRRLHRHIVTVGEGPGPGPGPDPVPPGPDPEPDPGKYGLAKRVKAALKAMGPDDRALAPTISANFSGVAAAMAAGTMTSEESIGELYRRNTAAHQGKQAWVAFFGQIRSTLNNLGIESSEDVAQAYREIADGLSAASRSRRR